VRYFAKHLGCRIASENYTMPPCLVASLTAADARPFEVTLARNSKIAGYPVRGRGVLHNFPTLGHSPIPTSFAASCFHLGLAPAARRRSDSLVPTR